MSCCAKLKVRGLNLINLEVVTRNLIAKSTLKVFEGGLSCMQLLIQFRLRNAKPNRKKKWSNGVEWVFLLHYLTTQGFNIWKRIMEAWEIMLEHIKILPLQDIFKFLNTHIWWNPSIKGIRYGISKNMATELDMKGFSYVKNLWDLAHNQPL